MCPACFMQILVAAAGSAGGAGALSWFWRRHKAPRQQHKPPSAEFKELIAVLLAMEESPQPNPKVPGIDN